jgi:5'-3' exoribonuclease 2
MAVLPAASSCFLPYPCRELMTRPDSPIVDFYPEKFDIDMEGKKFSWQGVPLLPFIKEELLIKTVRSVEDQFTDEELYRNRIGHDVIFVRNDHPLAKYFLSIELSKLEDDSTKIEFQNENVYGSISLSKEFLIEGPFIKSIVPGVDDVNANLSLCARYHLPTVPNDYVFKARLLNGVVYPLAVLSQEDLLRRSTHSNVHKYLREMEEYKKDNGPIDTRFQRRQDRQYQPYNDRRKSYPDTRDNYRSRDSNYIDSSSHRGDYRDNYRDNSHRGDYRDNYRDNSRNYQNNYQPMNYQNNFPPMNNPNVQPMHNPHLRDYLNNPNNFQNNPQQNNYPNNNIFQKNQNNFQNNPQHNPQQNNYPNNNNFQNNNYQDHYYQNYDRNKRQSPYGGHHNR